MGRAPCCDKANVKKGPWSPEEDAKLKAYIEKNGTGGNWIALPQKIGLKRCGKSCRLRWLNYLRPNIKHGGFTEEEDNIICSLYISIGSRWSIIAAQLPGRTDNDIKNYWNTRLKKKLLGRRKQSNNNNMNRSLSAAANDQDQRDVAEENLPNLQNLSSSALERLQLHIQLQTLQNPYFSFYNNPTLWPKLNPVQEKMLQVLQNSNLTQNTAAQIPTTDHNPSAGILLGQNLESIDQQAKNFEQDYPKTSSLLLKADDDNDDDDDERENSMNGILSSSSDSTTVALVPGGRNDQLDSSTVGINHHQTIPTTFAHGDEIENLLMTNSKSTGFPSNSGGSSPPMGVDFDDCLIKEIDHNGSRDNLMMWWSNDMDTNSESSKYSWDSTSLLNQSAEGMYQDYALGYTM